MSKTQQMIYSAYNNPIIADKYYEDFYKEDLPILSGAFDKFLDMLGDGRLLDLGCGAGQHCEWAAKRGFQVLGIDFSESMLKIANKLKSSNKIEYREGDLLNLEQALVCESKFDGLIMCFSLLCFNEKEVKIVLESAKNYLKHDGRIFVVTAEETEFGIGREVVEDEPFDTTEKQYYKYYTKEELKNLLFKFGFDDIIIEELKTPNPNDAAGEALVATAKFTG